MDIKEIQNEIERVDRAAEHNTDQKLVLGLIARGIWQVALQVARLTYAVDNVDVAGL